MKINTDDKTIVKNYFNAIGFDRWQNIANMMYFFQNLSGNRVTVKVGLGCI